MLELTVTLGHLGVGPRRDGGEGQRRPAVRDLLQGDQRKRHHGRHLRRQREPQRDEGGLDGRGGRAGDGQKAPVLRHRAQPGIRSFGSDSFATNTLKYLSNKNTIYTISA